MNNKFNKIFLLTPLFLLLSIICKGQGVGPLTFRATNLKTSEGVAIVNLFREQDDLPKKPFKTLNAVIQNGVAIISFDGIPHGEYAAIAYHDKNSDGILNHKMGFPNEPMGFSNNWNLSLFSGMPTFRKLRLEHSSSQTEILIKIE